MRKIITSLSLIFFSIISSGEEINLVCKNSDPNIPPTMNLTSYTIKTYANGTTEIFKNNNNLNRDIEDGKSRLISSKISKDTIVFEDEFINEEFALPSPFGSVSKGWSKSTTTISRIDGSWLIMNYWKGGMRDVFQPKPPNPEVTKGICEPRQKNRF